MKFFILFLLFWLTAAERCSRHCGSQAHRYLRYCMAPGTSGDLCSAILNELDDDCTHMLADARVCYPSLQKICPLTVIPWQHSDPDDRSAEEIFLEGTVQCIGEKFLLLDGDCQATDTVRFIQARSAYKKCVGASGAYLRNCRDAAQDDFVCKFFASQLQSMGCSDVLADMQTCAPDVGMFCPLPPKSQLPFGIMPPVAMPFPTTTIAVGVATTVNPSTPPPFGVPEANAFPGSSVATPPTPPVAGSPEVLPDVIPGSTPISVKHHDHGHDDSHNSAVPPVDGNVNAFQSPPGMPLPNANVMMPPPQNTPGMPVTDNMPPQNAPNVAATPDSTVASTMVGGALLVGGAPLQPPAGLVDPSTGSSSNGQMAIQPFPMLPNPMMFPDMNAFHGQCKVIRKIMKHCISEHLDDFSPQCQNTKLMQHLRRHLNEERLEKLDELWGPRRVCHHMRRHCKLVCAAAALVFTLLCLIWLVRERRRRALLRQPKPKTGTWSTGLFGSWGSMFPDWNTCLPSFFCPQLQTALNQSEIEDRNLACADVCVNLYKPMMFGNVYRDRQALRTKYDIPEAPCQDMLTAALCTPCAVAQHARELDARENVGQGATPFSYRPQVDAEAAAASVYEPAKPVGGIPLEQIMKL